MKRNKIEKWSEVVEEMLSPNPRLGFVQSQMKILGVTPGENLVECMEQALNRLDPQMKNKLVNKRSKIDEL